MISKITNEMPLRYLLVPIIIYQLTLNLQYQSRRPVDCRSSCGCDFHVDFGVTRPTGSVDGTKEI